MMGRRPDHRIRMMSQIAFAERGIFLDLSTWQDQRSRAVGLEDRFAIVILSMQYFIILHSLILIIHNISLSLYDCLQRMSLILIN